MTTVQPITVTLHQITAEMLAHTAAAKVAVTPADADPHIKAIAEYVVVLQDCGVTREQFRGMVAAAGGAR